MSDQTERERVYAEAVALEEEGLFSQAAKLYERADEMFHAEHEPCEGAGAEHAFYKGDLAEIFRDRLDEDGIVTQSQARALSIDQRNQVLRIAVWTLVCDVAWERAVAKLPID